MYQLIIIGGGASGLAAAVTAADLGVQKIAVLEQLPRTGKKLLATGNGRCNLSHSGIGAGDYQGSVDTAPMLEQFGDVRDFFAQLGLFLRTDEAGRMYPYSMTATAVLDALRLRLMQSGVEEHCGCRVTGLCRKGRLWHVRTEAEDFTAPYVIFAAGGHAAPKLGTDGSAWQMLRNLGIPLEPPRPVLCPVLSEPSMLRPLKGLRIRGNVTLTERGTPLRTEAGEVQFTEQALSGICLFNLSGLIESRHLKDYALHLNVLPESTPEELLGMLYAAQSARYAATAEELLTGLVQKPYARLVLKHCGIRAAEPCAQLTDRSLRQITETLRDLVFPVTGVAEFSQAQATAGGVSGGALDEHCAVRTCPGLFVTGEAADVHADCGGYHLHWCWASGSAAAHRIAELLMKGET